MISRLIQQKVPIGSKVRFTLKTGYQVSGVLVEIGRDHICIENKDGIATILTDSIEAWEVIGEEQKQKESTEKIDKAPSGRHSEVEIRKKVIEIETRFHTRIKNTRIGLKNPSFNFPNNEIQGEYHNEAKKVWDRIRSKYEYAQKINELSPKFGRIQPIANEMKSLVDHFPSSATLKSHLGYFYYLLENKPEALRLYKEAAIHSHKSDDWFNVAVLALNAKEEELACYALEQVFYKVPINNEENAWYIYIGLVQKFNSFGGLSKIYSAKKQKCLESDMQLLLEACIYLLKIDGKEERAANLTQKLIEEESAESLILEVFEQLKEEPVESYQQFVSEFEEARESETNFEISQQPQGYIYAYKKDRAFGFLRDTKGNNYFFHKSAVVDETLLGKLTSFSEGERIPVIFEGAQGPKGPVAVRVSLHRTIDEMFKLAIDYAESGEYSKAINQIRQVLKMNPIYPNANELYDKWREYARLSGVPKGSNPYARAKRAQLVEKDLERAVKLLKEAIIKGDKVESAIKDLAQLLVQLERPQEAIKVLQENKNKIRGRQSLNNLFISVYKAAGQYSNAIALLEESLTHAPEEKKGQILWQIATCYLREGEYKKAERTFRHVLKLHPENTAAKRNVALCLSKQERYEEAEKLLNQILDVSPDTKAAQLLETIREARAKGKSADVDELIIETTLSEYRTELSGLTQFALNNSDFQGIDPKRIKETEDGRKIYGGSQRDARYDLEWLGTVAKELGTRRPRDRAGYYLSAARISQDIGADLNQFYRYLCRSFASRGDACVSENKLLDSAREWYCEALSVYDGVRSRRKDEQDAVNALVRFLTSLLGPTHIPITPQIPPIDETIEEVLNQHPQREKVFDSIAYLTLHSRYAANRILRRLYNKSSLQAMSIEYLKEQGISVDIQISRLQDFVALWNKLRRKRLDEIRAISSELRFLRNIELTAAWLENVISRIEEIRHKIFLELDRQRTEQLQGILKLCLDLCKQVVFEEQERLCVQINSRCQDMMREIEDNPTRLSIEEIYPAIQSFLNKIGEYLESLYKTSVPNISIRLPIESYVPDSNRIIEVQVLIENNMGRSPAESLELIVQEDENYFTVTGGKLKREESLRGGEKHYFIVPLCITSQALKEQAFSMPVYVQYRTRSGEIEQTPINSFSIRLYSEEDFEEIPNPYAAYAEGGIVADPRMFYGRDELIENIVRAIASSQAQSKCIVIFGQKRAGKSSILYHLRHKLEKGKDILVLDLGNIGSILDKHSKFPLLYQILWTILQKLRYAIEDREDEGLTPLKLQFPEDREFYNHPSPLVLFKQVFDEYRRKASKHKDWREVQVVLLIDEFSYIYGLITSNLIPGLFMKNWKALLQENYFSAVLAGQDVMPKFKQRFPNEFGTTQDERVTYLREEDARRLIDEPIRIGGPSGESRYREHAIDRILELTAGSPFYTQIFCNRLVEYMNRKRAKFVTEADVEQVKNELIRGVNALSVDKFDNLINSGDTSEDAISDEDTLKVLKEIAINSRKGLCHRNNITCATDTPVDLILDDLVKRDVLRRERGYYYQIRVGLFREWLIANQ